MTINPTSPATAADHAGKYYLQVLREIHQLLQPKTYLEIGTEKGDSLALADCGSIAIDLKFSFTERDIMGQKPFCHLFQMASDDFFKIYDAKALLGRTVDFAFLDGLHRCEFLLRDFANTERNCAHNSIIALHDCLPVEPAMADRAFFRRPVDPRHAGWWAGDVWRTVLALKKWRPDLSIHAFDAPPTGLVLITDLNPTSNVLWEDYRQLVEEMLSYDLDQIGVPNLLKTVDIKSTSLIDSHEKLTRLFWL